MARRPPNRTAAWRAVAREAERLLDGVADPYGRGLMLRGEMTRGAHPEVLRPEDPQRIAARGLLRLAVAADRAAALLSEHADPRVRRTAALLGARAHPLIEGLDPELAQ